MMRDNSVSVCVIVTGLAVGNHEYEFYQIASGLARLCLTRTLRVLPQCLKAQLRRICWNKSYNSATRRTNAPRCTIRTDLFQ